VHKFELDLSNPNDMDCLLLSKKPLQRATRYTWIMTFDNHFQVEDKTSSWLVNYNNGVTLLYESPTNSDQDF